MTLNSRDMFPFERGVTMPHHEDDDLAVNTTEAIREDRAKLRNELPPDLPADEIGLSEGDDLRVSDADEMSAAASGRARAAHYRDDGDALAGMNTDGPLTHLRRKAERTNVVNHRHPDGSIAQDFVAPFEHLNFLPEVLTRDIEFILEKDVEYNASWNQRGGVGAFMMLARKWDRLEPKVKKYKYDVFDMLKAHPDRIDDIRDLRRYLALVESEAIRTGLIAAEE